MPNGNQFKQSLYNPIVWIVVGGAILAMLTFFVNAKLVSPLAKEVSDNKQIIKIMQEQQKENQEIYKELAKVVVDLRIAVTKLEAKLPGS